MFNVFTDKPPLSILKDMGPSNIETELRGLSPDGGGSIEVMQSFLRMIEAMLNTKCDFELAQAYLALFLKVNTSLNIQLSLYWESVCLKRKKKLMILFICAQY